MIGRLTGECELILISGFCNGVRAVLGSFKLLSFFSRVVRSSMINIHGPSPTVCELKMSTVKFTTRGILIIKSSFSGSIIPTGTMNYHIT